MRLFEGDGDIHKGNGYPRLYSVSEQLVKDVQQLLFGLGIVSSIHCYATANRHGKIPVYTLVIIQEKSIKEFIKNIGFISPKKQERLIARQKGKAYESYDVIPHQENLIRKLYKGPGRGSGKGRSKRGANRKLYRAIQHYLSNVKISSKRNLTRKKLKDLLERFKQLHCKQLLQVSSDEYFYSPVSEISIEKDHTAEIEVPGADQFVANSILVHNRRRGANMGVLHVWHPDIEEFIVAKQTPGKLENFNVSVAANDAFMRAVEKNKKYNLINPRTGRVVRTVRARELFRFICESAWKSAEPGMLFIDRMNKTNPTPKYTINATNPCVTGDTLVSTNEGLTEIKKLHNPHHVLGMDGKYHPIRWAGETGEKEVYLVKTKAGYEVKATENHKFFIKTENGYTWKLLKELTNRDRLVLQGAGNFGTLSIDKEMALALGWLVGDGHVSKGIQDAIFYFNKQEKAEILPIIKNYLDIKNGKPIKAQQNATEFRLKYSSKIAKLFSNLGLQPYTSDHKEVPASVFKMNKESTGHFLSALFGADGSVQGTVKKGVSIRLTSISSKLLKQVQLLLLQFGIFSTLYENRKKAGIRNLPDSDRRLKEYPTKPLHELILSRASMLKFMKEIGFCVSAKNKKFDTVKPKKRWYRDNIDSSIKKIKKIGFTYVYDLTEPATHSFAANGIIVHNCGEVPMPDYESCILGSINLAPFVAFDWTKKPWRKKLHWKRLRKVVHLATRFLDNVVTINQYPLPQIREMTLRHRRLGLGVMGFATLLAQIGIRYDSREAYAIGEAIMKFITAEARAASVHLAKERGSFPGFKESTWHKKYSHLRNATVTSIAPTGSISMIADTSSGIEPLFALSYLKTVRAGRYYYSDETFEHALRMRGLYSETLMEKIRRTGSIQKLRLPRDLRNVFRMAYDMPPEAHVRMQAAFQRYTDLAVSKTINLPASATVKDVERVYWLAWKLGCKGITIYRSASRREQVLHVGQKPKTHGVLAD